jgi:hypothetical protein
MWQLISDIHTQRLTSMADNETERLERLERRVDFLIRHLGIDPASIESGVAAGPYGPVPAGLGGMAGDALPEPMYDAIRAGKLINAIKIYREATGASLAEAKSAVESIARGM